VAGNVCVAVAVAIWVMVAVSVDIIVGVATTASVGVTGRNDPDWQPVAPNNNANPRTIGISLITISSIPSKVD
jgi:hypothetical protein